MRTRNDWSHSDNPIRSLQSPRANADLTILISKLSKVFPGKTSPGIIRRGQELYPLHLVALFREQPEVAVDEVMFAIQVSEQLLPQTVSFERLDPRVQFVLIDLDR